MKNFSIIALLFSALFISNHLSAQKSLIGIKIGGNINVQTSIPKEFDGTPLIRRSFGVFYRIPVNSKFAIQPEAILSYQGVNIDLTIKDLIIPGGAILNVDNKVRDKLTYLNFPIIGRFMVSKRIALEVGPQIGISLGGKRVGPATTTVFVPGFGFIKNDFEDNQKLTTDTHLKSIETSLVGGFAYEGESGLGFNVRLQYGLTGAYRQDPNLQNPATGLNIDITKTKNALVNVGLTYAFK